MTKLFLIAATMLSAVTSPVVAREARPAASTETAQASSTQRTENPAQRYCVITMMTGSHIPHKTCQSRQEWLDDGFDPLAKN